MSNADIVNDNPFNALQDESEEEEMASIPDKTPTKEKSPPPITVTELYINQVFAELNMLNISNECGRRKNLRKT
jgi:hypothetical protein